MARRRAVGFYTDERGRVRPLTAPSGRRFRVVRPNPSRYETRTVQGPGGSVTVTRSRRAWSVDERRAAKTVTEDPFKWSRNMARMDYPGVDMPQEAGEAYVRRRREEEAVRLREDVGRLEEGQRQMWNVASRRLASRGAEVEGGRIIQVYDGGEDPWTGEHSVTFYGSFKLGDGRNVGMITVRRRLSGPAGRRRPVYEVEV